MDARHAPNSFLLLGTKCHACSVAMTGMVARNANIFLVCKGGAKPKRGRRGEADDEIG